MRFIVVIGMVWLLAGCSGGALIKTVQICPDQQEQEQFRAALDQFIATEQPQALQQFQIDYPSSPWAEQAKKLADFVQSQAGNLNQLETRKQQLDTELTELKRENELLNEKIEQLKELLIELEQRPR